MSKLHSLARLFVLVSCLGVGLNLGLNPDDAHAQTVPPPPNGPASGSAVTIDRSQFGAFIVRWETNPGAFALSQIGTQLRYIRIGVGITDPGTVVDETLPGTVERYIIANIPPGGVYQIEARHTATAIMAGDGTTAATVSDWILLGVSPLSPLPTFRFVNTGGETFSTPENAVPSSLLGPPLSARIEGLFGGYVPGELVYSLDPAHDDIAIDPATGQLHIGDSPTLDHESEPEIQLTAVARVVIANRDFLATRNILGTVTDIAEPPRPPAPPGFFIDSPTSVIVSWLEPENTDRPPISRYDVQLRVSGTPENALVSTNGQQRSQRFADLSSVNVRAGAINVQVRARNDEGIGSFSGVTALVNSLPTFAAVAPIPVPETVPVGTNIGAPIVATDTDNGRLSYTVQGPEVRNFAIDSESGQLRTRALLDYETQTIHIVTVSVDDDQTGTDTVMFDVNVANEIEPPSAPSAPTVTAGSSDRLSIAWVEPTNTGPPITDYDVQYRLSSAGAYSNLPHAGIATAATVTGLTPNSAYQFRVRAGNADGDGAWSPAAMFNTPQLTSARIEVAERVALGNVGAPLDAVGFPPGQQIWSILSGDPDSVFAIDLGTGQLRNVRELDFESGTQTYMLEIQLAVGNLIDTAIATINVGDEPEPPGVPAAPTLIDVLSTSLTIRWEAPPSAGSSITDYDVQYQDVSNGNLIDVPHTGTATSVLITGLMPNSMYLIRVRATNADSTGAYSEALSVSTTQLDSQVFTVPETAVSVDIGMLTASGFPTDIFRVWSIVSGNTNNAFSMNPATGELTARSLDFEGTRSYTLEIKLVAGPAKGTATATVNVTNVIELPAAPTLTVTGFRSTSLAVEWQPPENTGPPITGYEVRYREQNTLPPLSVPYLEWPHDGTTTSTTITGLTPQYEVEVQVRAVNDEGAGEWSSALRIQAPLLPSGRLVIVLENAPVGTLATLPPVAIGIPQQDRQWRIVDGNVGGVFNIDPQSGNITVAAMTLDFENKAQYNLTLQLQAGVISDTASQFILILDVDEPPAAPDVPTLLEDGLTTLEITWLAPTNTGPPITDYDVEYRVAADAGAWTTFEHTGTATSTTITGLQSITGYQFRVRASNDEGTGAWSAFGTEDTEAVRAPKFPLPVVRIAAPENTPIGGAVGAPIAATDPDGTTPIYSLDTKDGANFSIGPDGQLRINLILDFENPTGYVVVVTASDSDGLGGKDKASVIVTVADVAEPPDAPAAPTVTAVSATDPTGLTVSWTAPNNAGPSSRTAITDYDVRYRLQSSTDPFTDLPDDAAGTATMASVTGLSPGTAYQVQVRAGNDEGDSAWSPSGSGSTAANQPPGFNDAPGPIARAVNENSVVSTRLGAPIAATDANGDPITYRLEGTNAGDFRIDAAGQVSTAIVVDHEMEPRYELMVVASDDRGDSARIDLTITVTDLNEPPDAPAAPTVVAPSTVASTSLTVSWTAPNNTGPSSRTAITDYDVRYRLQSNTGLFTDLTGTTGTATTAAITDLLPGTAYQVQVRATNAEGPGAWSPSGSGSTAANQPPRFNDAPGPVARAVNENSVVSTRLGAPIAVTDADGDTITYRLEGANAGDFRIDAAGQVSTAIVVDHELLGSYSLMVVATDNYDARAQIELTIMINDLEEPPDAPVAPTVTAFSATDLTRLAVNWTAPNNTGPSSRTAIVDYDVRYRLQSSSSAFTDLIGTTGTATTATIISLSPDTAYQVQVRATNAEGLGAWSPSGSGSTSANQPPEFSPGPVSREVAENSTNPAAVGAPIIATDPNGDPITYRLEGANASDFRIDATGQVRIATIVDHERSPGYSLMVVASDDRGGSARIDLTITVTDLNEPPDAPVAPTVTAPSTVASTSLTVSWTAPNNTGPSSRTAITDYDVRYRLQSNTGLFTDLTGTTGTATTAAITDLLPGTAYQVQVRATNAEGPGAWSPSGSGSTAANQPPRFNDAPGPVARAVNENSVVSTRLGAPIAVTDADGDTITYRLEGANAGDFRIDAAGQVSTAIVVDHELLGSYSLMVVATDNYDARAQIELTIMINDLEEPPDAPVAPTVTAFSATDLTRLAVNWTAPNNTGPSSRTAIVDYDVRYRLQSSSSAFTDLIGTTGTATTATIISLSPDTAYQVQVRATNAEGLGAWSPSGSGSTSANQPPEFSPGPVSREVAENSTNPTVVGAPIIATDPNGDPITYRLEGVNAGDFRIDAAGQVSTAIVVDHEMEPRYELMVVVGDDRGGSARIDLTITVTDLNEPPDAPVAPTVTAPSTVASTSLTVSWTAPNNTGPSSRTAITDYEVRYRQGSTGLFTDLTGTTGTATTAAITGLSPDTAYQVQVRATNAEGPGAWSPSGSGATSANQPPRFNDAPGPVARAVNENSIVSTRLGAPIATTDADGDTITYRLEGANAGNFRIDAAGQVSTAIVVDHELLGSYSLMVVATDNYDARAQVELTIMINDLEEPPDAPVAPTVTAFSATDLTRLAVSWTAPNNTGPSSRTAIVDYDVRYRLQSSSGAFTDLTGTTGTATTATIISLSPDTAYQVQVRATNAEGPGAWSPSGSGTTPVNQPPEFSPGPVSREVVENSTNPTVVGAPIIATDPNGDPITYRLEGANASDFRINATGQVRIATIVDHELRPGYSLMVVADDDRGGSARIDLTITVTDLNEPPDAPVAPTVVAPSAVASTSLTVSWTAPNNTGPSSRTAITDYDVRYREGSTGLFIDLTGTTDTATTATITGLLPDTAYQVQVRATNAEGPGAWSPSGSGTTSENQPPRFNEAPGPVDRAVNENSIVSTRLGAPIAVTDADGDTITYRLEGANAGNFRIDAAGQVSTAIVVDHELLGSYRLMVVATDNYDARAQIELTIMINDLEEPPDAPAVPTVTAFSATDLTRLAVSWTAPNNTGPSSRTAIVDYDVRYRLQSSSGAFTDLTGTTGTATTAAITGLSPDTAYQVQVRATNAEGTGAWSPSGSGSTSANQPPEFSPGPVSREVAENSTNPTVVGAAIIATDPNGDPITYRLEGANASDFRIDATGQVRVATIVDHELRSGYSLMVVADDDRGGSARIDLTITVTDLNEPPDAPTAPTVVAPSAVASTSLTVSWTAPNNTGPSSRTAITGYDVRYREGGTGPFADLVGATGTATTATITSLSPDTAYQVQVRATNAEGTGAWSPSGSGSTSANQPPEFSPGPVSREVAENSTNPTAVGAPIIATDPNGDPITYRLEGANAGDFRIDATGQVRIATIVDHELRPGYSLIVVASDDRGGSARIDLTITINDLNEPPDAPAVPAVTAFSATDLTRLAVSWTAPNNAGPSSRTAIVDYDVRYRLQSSSGAFTDLTGTTGTATTATIISLSPDTAYQVQVRATNAEGPGAWSPSGSGSTSANQPPEFSPGPVSREVVENSTNPTVVGAAIIATDPNGDPITYRLEGANAGDFRIDATGQVRVATIVDHELRPGYSLMVVASDDRGGSARIDLAITVTDLNEPPDAPIAPTVTAPSAVASTSLTVSWTAPNNTGPSSRTAITDYEVRYREGSIGPFADLVGTTGTATTAAITGLLPDTAYQVQVRATNAEGTGAWSPSGSGSTSANQPPEFSPGPVSREVAENSANPTVVGAPIIATDPNGDPITYRLEGANAGDFRIEATGQVRIATVVDHELRPGYSLMVVASDDRGGSARIDLTITVTDLNEPPDAPTAPTVTAFSVTDLTRLAVSWTAPNNAGPSSRTAIVDYDVRYRLQSSSGAFTDLTGTTGTATTAAITSLSPDTAYQVQVRATNAEGTGVWSPSGSGATSANQPPEFSPGPVSREVAENSTNPTVVGAPIIATDPNGDPITYRLEGANAGDFRIDATGQVRVATIVDHELRPGYSLMVVASDDRGGSARIDLAITVTDLNEPPDAPATPTVTAPSVTDLTRLAVSWTAPNNAGPSSRTAITDYDVRYRLQSSSGAFTDLIGITGTATTATITGLSPNTAYQVQVRATNAEGAGAWSPSGSGTTSANQAPEFSPGPVSREVAENSTNPTVVGAAIIATDPNGDSITYRLEGANAGDFRINATGQVRIATIVDHELRPGYSLMVVASDDRGGSARIDLTITVTDLNEPPDAPVAPTVVAPSAVASTSLTVSWTAPNNTGPSSRTAITDYDVRYREGGTGLFTELTGTTDTATTAAITGLSPDTAYQVQVRATNAEGPGAWSPSGSGATSANQPPRFNDAPSPVARAVNENSAVSTRLGASIAATDANDDPITYRLEGANAGDFRIDAAGQLRTAIVVDHELLGSYRLMVVATDNDDARAQIELTITINDLEEPPDAPATPTVVAPLAIASTRLAVSWTAPNNAGPSSRTAITDYDVRHRLQSSSGAFTDLIGITGTATTATITGLSPNTAYQIQVRATNAEGPGAWSPSGSGATSANQPPRFNDAPGPIDRAVSENSPVSTRLGAPVTATDPNPGEPITYRLEGANAGDFRIDAAGQVSTAIIVDHELRPGYSLVVVASDDRGGSARIDLTITINDLNEPPDAPAAPTVTAPSATDLTRLTVSWTAPNNAGPSSRTTITDYDVRYRLQSSSGAFTDLTGITGTATTATITGLSPNTAYQVQVRATNAEATGAWSPSGSGSTSANQPPAFASPDAVMRDVDENSPVSTRLGVPITATDANPGDTITYNLEGANADDFRIDDTGQVSTAIIVDYESHSSYRLMVVAGDDRGGSTRIALTITITDLEEPPDAPVTPMVAAASTTGLSVSWTAPNNFGPTTRTAITDYDMRYRLQSSSAFTVLPDTISTVTSATIPGLSPNTAYAVQVRAVNDEGESAWTPARAGTTDANLPPVFGATDSLTLRVSENTPPDRPVGASITATDPNGDTLTYRLEGADAGHFDIDPVSGQLWVRSSLDFELRSEYTVSVVVEDPQGVTDRIEVVILVTDVNEDGSARRVGRLNADILPRVAKALTDSTNRLVIERLERIPAPGGVDQAGWSMTDTASLSQWLKRYGDSGTEQEVNPTAGGAIAFDQLVADLSFAVDQDDPGIGGLGFYGSGDYVFLAGDDQSLIDWDGDLVGGHIGVDVRLGADRSVLAGVAVSWFEGAFGYRDIDPDAALADLVGAQGKYRIDLLSLHPYVGWSLSEQLDAWLSIGVSNGKIRIDDSEQVVSGDVTIRSASVGADGVLLSSDELIIGGHSELVLRGDASLSSIAVEPSAGFEDAYAHQYLRTHRLRLRLEASHSRETDLGQVRGAVEWGVRHDSGAGAHGPGIEVGSALDWSDARRGLSVGVGARALTAAEYMEWGVNGRFRIDPGLDGQGLGVRMEPSYGQHQSGLLRLWEGDIAGRDQQDEADRHLRMDSELGYGVAWSGGLLTPYAGLSLRSDGRDYRLGSRFAGGRAWSLSVQGRRRESASRAPEHDLELRLQLDW